MKANPFKSAGARAERAAMRGYLRRRIRKISEIEQPMGLMRLEEVLAWVLTRQSRYDKRKGGLGRK
jgi:hypothetical protein